MNQGSRDAGQKLVEGGWEQRGWSDFSGEQAYKYGFVDELGNWETAKERALTLAGISDANFMQFQPEFSLANLFQILGKSEKTTLKVDLGLSAPAVEPGYMYFLSPSYCTRRGPRHCHRASPGAVRPWAPARQAHGT